jgi:apolipoprotein N-acyltransferase
LSWPEVAGNSLGLALVSMILLCGLTGVDWETPAGALSAWPVLLRPLRWVGLPGVALAIGAISLLLGSLRARAAVAGGLLLAAWVVAALAFPMAPTLSFPLPVALVQTGFSQHDKWDAEGRTRGIDRLLSQTKEAAAAGARLVIWPETAWPHRGMRRRVTNTRRIGLAARELGVDILATSIEEIPGQEPRDWQNSASLILASGKFTDHYEKRRLAPFAEYMPLPDSWQAVLRRVRPFSYISRFVPGPGSRVFRTSTGQRFAVLICYESMTPGMAAEMAPQVDFLVVVTNDAPFDSSQANEAHFRSAVLRAVETGKPVLQAGNTGVTGAVGADGMVLVRTPPGFSGPSVQYLSP